MKKKKFVSAIAMTLALLCAFTLGANAAGTMQEIKAYLNSGITIKLDGQEQVLKDANGTRIFPITYNGSNYLPIGAVCDMLGISAQWDAATQTALLGKQGSGVDLIDTYKAFQFNGNGERSWAGQVQSADGKTAEIGGLNCSHWLYFGTAWWNSSDASASFNLQGKHDTLTFSYFSNISTTLTITGDNGNVLGEYDITGGAVPQTVTIPLFKTNELKFYMHMPDWNTSASIFNAYLDAEQ